MTKGKVYLVGAGPGDPGLVTLKALKCLKETDVIVYDRLVNPELLKFASAKAELIYAGKSPKGHTFSQDKINLLLVKKAREGKVVLRLKGGDAFLFSRGAEEAICLSKQKIPFEIVPGVTSAIAVPAYAGIPLTHRRYTSSIGIFTGHEDPNKKSSSINWKKISTGLGTLVFLMGVSNLGKIVNKLISSGRPKTTPCCLIQSGTLPEQKAVRATLQTIARKAGQDGFSHPAVLVIGEVVRLRKQLNWFENKTLFGKKILITCHQQAGNELAAILKHHAASVVKLPLIKIAPLEDYRQLDLAITKISDFEWTIFSSQNGVKQFKQRLDYLGKNLKILNGIKLAAIGPKTRMSLEALGLKVDVCPQRYCQEGLLDYFSKRQIKGEGFLLVCSTGARDKLADNLKSMGASVAMAPAYKTEPVSYKSEDLNKILRDIDVITFSSVSSVRNFFKIIPRRLINRMLKKSLVASIGPVTSREANYLGLEVDIEAKQYTIDGLTRTIMEYYQNDKYN